MTSRYSLSKKVALEAVSRGGLFALSAGLHAARNPFHVFMQKSRSATLRVGRLELVRASVIPKL